MLISLTVWRNIYCCNFLGYSIVISVQNLSGGNIHEALPVHMLPGNLDFISRSLWLKVTDTQSCILVKYLFRQAQTIMSVATSGLDHNTVL